MDVNSLGSMYLDNYRLGAPTGGDLVNPAINGVNNLVNQGKNEVNNPANFEQLLNKTAAPQPMPEQASHASNTVKIDKTDKLYEQCQELEIFLVKTLISSMRNTVQKSGLIDEGFAGKMYEDMLYDEYARDFAKNADFGLADMAYLELTGQRNKIVIRN
jgi:flagellar protein FlgJ